MIESQELAKNIKGIYPIPYSGEVLYNVLLESYEKMIVNNLIVETLNPTNIIAKLYSNKFSKDKRNFLITKYNNFIKTKTKQDLELSQILLVTQFNKSKQLNIRIINYLNKYIQYLTLIKFFIMYYMNPMKK